MLFGEYAVLEGHECLVVAIDRSVCTHYTPANTIAVNAPSYGRHEPKNNLKELPNLCENLININSVSTDLVESFEKKYLANLNDSASFAAQYLVNKLKI